MKRLLIIFIVAVAAALLPVRTAYASDYTYLAKPTGRECYFFSDKDLSAALFAVPYSYCVRVIKSEGEWLYASYAEDEDGYKKLYGYCKSEEFERVTSLPKCEYLNKTVTVTYTASGGESSFKPPSDMQVEALYYGEYRHGANSYSYVLCRNAFCYVEGANDDYPLNEYEKQTEADGDESIAEEKTNTTGLIIFTVVLAVALVTVCGIAFGAKRKNV